MRKDTAPANENKIIFVTGSVELMDVASPQWKFDTVH